ncbi:HD-GYP domain-containing protein [Pseudothauera nasutitermitis]|uniref:HD-GYP domain-containing protein n=1 Tax=Pseudothauera nasutitermitis TaxID=2565930 RepID=A0A4S4B2V3_9RHOO|nr:HD-GYP domain-containing protein [Pseudothauera nasutitermitis]THF66942.1 HD-GYP domain-containing protein [Pseudothauera nasutitermitis]
MLKRIPITHLRPGMYIQELCGSWMEHPFWRNSFLLDDPGDIRRIAECGIHEVWIDTDKGLDALGEIEGAVDKASRDREVEDELQRAAAAPAVQRASMREEVERATQICARARGAVVSMFGEARMGRAIEAEAALPLVDEISRSVSRNPGALISLARLKTADDYTYMHSVAVCALMIALARQFDMTEDQVRQAGLAGLLHDLGKALIPNEVLNKPGKLTDTEFDIVKAHPVKGHEMLLEAAGADAVALDVCLHHHEKMDGTGYPHRLNGEQISLFAKMGAVCDVYDAITSNRPYKAGWDPGESIRRMVEWSKGHFDEKVFQAFVRSVGIYPVGSLVRLESGRLGVVMDQGSKSLLKPRLRVFYSTRADAHIQPEIVDLARPGCAERIVATEDPTRWHFKNLDQLWRDVA